MELDVPFHLEFGSKPRLADTGLSIDYYDLAGPS
jgi:hypothetical protein